MKDTVIVDGVRTPVGNHGGALRSLLAKDLLALVFKGILERTKIDPASIDEVGKLPVGESPFVGACREAHEELGVKLVPSDLHLTGLVSEHGYQGQNHWLMFLFEVKRRLTALPPPHAEGYFQFFSRDALPAEIPQTDRERIWPWFWEHRGGFFAAHCHCHPDGTNKWTLEQSSGLPSLAGSTLRSKSDAE